VGRIRLGVWASASFQIFPLITLAHSTGAITYGRIFPGGNLRGDIFGGIISWHIVGWMSYGCESWTLKSTDEDRIKSLEMKAFRQILRVTWTDKRTNDWVLRKAGTEPFLLQSVKKRKLSYYGHVLRKEENCMEKEIMQGTTCGQKRKGRARTLWQDNITNGLG